MDENKIVLECDFEFKCPKKWENFLILDDPEKRFCNSCEREVFFVTSRKELETYKKLGRCVAADVHSSDLAKSITIAGGAYPRNTSIIQVFGDQENTDEVIVALNNIEKKKRQKIEKSIKRENKS